MEWLVPFAMDFSLLTSSIGLIAMTLRPSREDVVGESARPEYGSALVREAVPTRLAGAAASATMGAMREVASSVSVRRRVALIVWLLCVVGGCATVVLLLIGPGRVLPSDIFSAVGGASFLILALTFAFVGVVVARRVPEIRIGSIS